MTAIISYFSLESFVANYLRHVNDFSASGMRLKDLDICETISQNSFTRKIVAKLRSGEAKRSRAVLEEVNLGLLLGHPGKISDNMTKPLLDLLNQEMKMLTSLQHPNIVQLYNAIIEKDCLYFVVDYFEEGTLYRALQMRTGKMVPEPILEPQALEWFTQLSRGLQYLHVRDLIHCHISAKNVFFTSNMKNIKLGDCGIARIVNRTGQLSKQPLSNLCYTAPEIWDGKPYTKRADIWSMGILLYQLLSLKLPYEGTNDIELFFKIKAGARPMISFAYSNETLHLVDQMLKMDPTGRPLIDEVVVDLECAITARPFQTVYWWNLKAPMRTSSSFIANANKGRATKEKQNKPWLKTPSKIVELLNYRAGGDMDVILIVCEDGEIMAIANIFDQPEAIVRWRGRVTVPRTVNSGETVLAHASMYRSRAEIYFTISPPTEGIFQAEVKDIITNKSPVELKRFDKGYASALESDRLFNGLVVDVENQAILCCDQSRKRTIGVWSVVDGRIHTEITLAGAGDNQFRPFKVCLHPVLIPDSNKRCQLLGVCDSPNSKIHLFMLTKSTKSGSAGLVEAQFLRTLATKGSMVGSVCQPQGVFFDPNGHLLVADAGNHRIQIFSAEMPDVPVKGVLWDSFTTNTAGAFAEPVSVISALDEAQSRPVILAGLHEDQEVLIFK